MKKMIEISKTGISLPTPIFKEGKRKASGNFSHYLANLIEQDLKGEIPTGDSKSILANLASRYRKSAEKEIQEICEVGEINQVAVLEALLAALPAYLARTGRQDQYYIELVKTEELEASNKIWKDLYGKLEFLSESLSHPEVAPIPKRDLAAAAGGGAVVEDESVDGHIFFRRDWLQKNGLDPDLCCSIIVTGESMEPTLPEGSTIVVNCSIKRQHNGRIYVIRTSDGLVVKRAGKSEDGGWLLISDHPAHGSVPWPDDAEVVGEVVWGAQTFL